MAAAKNGTAPQPWRPSPTSSRRVREYFESFCVAVILALFVRTFVVQAFKIPTGSMENNLLVGDHLLVNKMVFAPTLTGLERTLLPIDPVKRGDILVFKFPEDPTRDFIKRVIGLPGDTLELKGKTVYINGKPLDEPYVRFLFPDDLPPGRRAGRHRSAAEVRTGHRSGRSLLHDGRQPRQLGRQPLLGLHAALVHQGEGAVRVLLVRRRQRLERDALEHPLGPDVAPDSLSLRRPR